MAGPDNPGWCYDGTDAGIRLFDACLKAGAPLSFQSGMKVLEVGCNESDWLERAATAWPEVEFLGIDTRVHETPTRALTRYGNALDPDAFPEGSFDAVVSLSAIEHIGLGHYGDPKDKDGDSKAVANIWRWLKPGGWFYFDVPYNPEGYSVLGTECRIYDDETVVERLRWSDELWDVLGAPSLIAWEQECARWYSDSKTPSTLADKPTKAAPRYWYVAMCWQKA